MKADTLIAMFHNRHVHLAVVQDIGKTVGLVTLDDVLDQLIGNDQGPARPIAAPRRGISGDAADLLDACRNEGSVHVPFHHEQRVPP